MLSSSYIHYTDHQLYTAAVIALTGELSGVALSKIAGDRLYAECQRRGKVRIWEVALEDSTLKVEATKDNASRNTSHLHQTTQAVNIVRIDFCNNEELLRLIKHKKRIEELRDVIGVKDGYYCTKVIGNSMTNAGIDDGDSLIVRRDIKLIDNTVQIVGISGKYFVKRVAYTNEGLELRSESPMHGTMAFAFDEADCVEPLGVVQWVVKDVR